MAGSKITIEQALATFWAQVDVRGPDDCWLWMGSLNAYGYGRVCFLGRRPPTHKIAYIATHGEPPADKPWILHSCDSRYEPTDKTNRRCCNPAHLYPGTVQDNQKHMAEVGRSTIGDRNPARLHPERMSRGEKHGHAKLTEADVIAIRKATGSQSKIARLFGVTQSRISEIKRRNSWKHLP